MRPSAPAELQQLALNFLANFLDAMHRSKQRPILVLTVQDVHLYAPFT